MGLKNKLMSTFFCNSLYRNKFCLRIQNLVFKEINSFYFEAKFMLSVFYQTDTFPSIRNALVMPKETYINVRWLTQDTKRFALPM